MRRAGVMLSAIAASICPLGTARIAPRTTSAPYAPMLSESATTPATNGVSVMPKSGSAKKNQNIWTSTEVPRKTST
jgi:hypothetical protein